MFVCCFALDLFAFCAGLSFAAFIAWRICRGLLHDIIAFACSRDGHGSMLLYLVVLRDIRCLHGERARPWVGATMNENEGSAASSYFSLLGA
jgi:hypothetical protein